MPVLGKKSTTRCSKMSKVPEDPATHVLLGGRGGGGRILFWPCWDSNSGRSHY